MESHPTQRQRPCQGASPCLACSACCPALAHLLRSQTAEDHKQWSLLQATASNSALVALGLGPRACSVGARIKCSHEGDTGPQVCELFGVGLRSSLSSTVVACHSGCKARRGRKREKERYPTWGVPQEPPTFPTDVSALHFLP